MVSKKPPLTVEVTELSPKILPRLSSTLSWEEMLRIAPLTAPAAVTRKSVKNNVASAKSPTGNNYIIRLVRQAWVFRHFRMFSSHWPVSSCWHPVCADLFRSLLTLRSSWKRKLRTFFYTRHCDYAASSIVMWENRLLFTQAPPSKKSNRFTHTTNKITA